MQRADRDHGSLTYRREDLARLAPARLGDEAFPPVAYLPGRGPHPIRSPEGHLHGHQPSVVLGAGGLDAGQPDWRAGVDLHDQGYFWEAHERWEGLWHALGRRGDEADLLKALIQTAAAQIKLLEGARRGVELLATKSGIALADLARRRPALLDLDLPAFVRRRRAWFDAYLAGVPVALERFPFIAGEARR